MKYFYPIVILVFFVSCRKDDTSFVVLTTGNSDELTLTVHDTIINAKYDGSWNQKFFKLNLDNAAGDDITFFSQEDTNSLVGGMYTSAWIQINNSLFSIAEVDGSGVHYETYATSFDFYGTYPRRTNHITSSCSPSANSVADTSYTSVLTFQPGVDVIDYLDWDNLYSRVDLVVKPSIYYSYDYTQAGDSLVGNYYIKEGICSVIPEDEIFYIVFKKVFDKSIRYGWIEMKITDDNSIHILRSAITD